MSPLNLPIARRHASRAFTLIELIVVIVILGILAALAVPSFSAVIDRSRDASDEAFWESVGREAAALAAFDQTEVTAAHIATALADAGMAADMVLAQATTTTYDQDTGDGMTAGEWSYASNGTEAYIAVIPHRIVDADRVLYVEVRTTSSDAEWEAPDYAADGDGSAATTDGADAAAYFAATATVENGGGGGVSAPDAPTNVSTGVSNTDVTVTWDSVAEADTYTVLRDGAEVATDLTATSYLDTGLANGTYSYTVTATNAGGESAASAPAAAEVAADPAIASGATGYWELDGDHLDAVAPASDGAVNGSIAFQTGPFAGTQSVDFTGGWLELGQAAKVKSTTEATFEAWINPDTLGSHMTILRSGAATEAFYFRVNSNGAVRVGVNTTSGWMSCPTITTVSAGTWSHVAATISNADGARVYINGVERGTCGLATPTMSSSAPTWIGATGTNNSEKFDGRIARVATYDYVLTPTQIAEHAAVTE